MHATEEFFSEGFLDTEDPVQNVECPMKNKTRGIHFPLSRIIMSYMCNMSLMKFMIPDEGLLFLKRALDKQRNKTVSTQSLIELGGTRFKK